MIKLLPQFLSLVQQWRPCFADYRTHRRAVGFALSLLVCLGRRTISRAICAQQRQFRSWASDYKLFSLSRWTPRSLFDVVLKLALPLMSKTQPLVVALDDTITRKTGHRIPNASTLRDPLSPPYHTNLVWALRFIQAVLLICPVDSIGAARAIPIAFNLAPPVPKPKKKKASAKTTPADKNDKVADAKKAGKKTTDPEWKQYYKLRRQQGLSAQGAVLIQQIRSGLDEIAGYAQRILWVVVDASYCNLTVLSRLAERTVLIGRTRKDIHLSALPQPQSGRGRRPVYGKDLDTPEQMRKDDSIPWQQATIFAAGRSHQLRYKSVGPVLWRRGAQRRPLRLIIIAPLAYYAHGHRLYRQPAYLLVTDPAADVHSHPLFILRGHFQPGARQGALRRRDGELDEAPHLLDIFFLDVLPRIESLYFARDAARELGCVEFGDACDAALSAADRLPGVLRADAHWRDQTDTRYYHSSRQKALLEKWGSYFLAVLLSM